MESYIHLYKTNEEFTAAYNSPNYKEPWLSLTEENMTIGYSKPKLTAITFDSITWVTDIPATGGTATKDNCSFKVYGNYEDGTSADISTIVTVTGELAVKPSTAEQRHEAGQLTLTASYSGFTATGNVTAYQEAFDLSMEPLTFNILSAGTINWTASNTAATKTIDYKINDGQWASITSNTGSSAPTINVVEGDKVQFRGNNTQYGSGTSKLDLSYNSFSSSTALFEAEGNIMSLIYGDDFKNNLTISSTRAFYGLFSECVNLVSAENLVLPATTLTDSCYYNMFNGCTSLTIAPELPATTLASACYCDMFGNCASLTTAPKELPATTLVDNCYAYMFEGCTSLTTAPSILPATILEYYCCSNMFRGCVSLKTAPELPATKLAQYCYQNMFDGCTSLTTAPKLPATTLANNCYYQMFKGCSSLTIAPALPATTLANSCYSSMFRGCASLTTAPELPATTLASYCYASMFRGCTNLNYIKCLATDISASDCTSNWVRGVASTGTFVKPSSMASWTTGVNGIPSGWTAQNAS